MQSICSFASFTASCSCGISVCNVDRGKKQACRVARDRCSHTNLTIHAEFRSGSRDIDNPPFFASRSEKNIGRSPVLKSRLLIHKALPQSDLPVGIDSGKRLSKFTTLEGEGLSCGGVDGSSLPWVQPRTWLPGHQHSRLPSEHCTDRCQERKKR